MSKFGLVLSGGGARGAYQAGIVKALAHCDFEPDVVAGASIGALNGAVVSDSATMEEAAARLMKLWGSIVPDDIIKPANTLGMLSIAFMHASQEDYAQVSQQEHQRRMLNHFTALLREPPSNPAYLLDTEPVQQLLHRSVNIKNLATPNAREFFVSAYPASGKLSKSTILHLIQDLWRYHTRRDPSVFVRIRDVPPEDIVNYLLASAALPIAFAPITVGSDKYFDGGMGDKRTSQGNTPMTPLINAGCTTIVVSILGDGDLWSRYDWKNVSIVEIRPSISLSAGSSGLDLFDFSRSRIERLILQGEADTLRIISQIQDAVELFSKWGLSRKATQQKVADVKRQQAKIQRRIEDIS